MDDWSGNGFHSGARKPRGTRERVRSAGLRAPAKWQQTQNEQHPSSRSAPSEQPWEHSTVASWCSGIFMQFAEGTATSNRTPIMLSARILNTACLDRRCNIDTVPDLTDLWRNQISSINRSPLASEFAPLTTDPMPTMPGQNRMYIPRYGI